MMFYCHREWCGGSLPVNVSWTTNDQSIHIPLSYQHQHVEVLSSQGHELPGNMLKITTACNQEHHVKIPLSQKLIRKVLWINVTEIDQEGAVDNQSMSSLHQHCHPQDLL